jgi:hypothetical protein
MSLFAFPFQRLAETSSAALLARACGRVEEGESRIRFDGNMTRPVSFALCRALQDRQMMLAMLQQMTSLSVLPVPDAIREPGNPSRDLSAFSAGCETGEMGHRIKSGDDGS